MSSKVVLLDLEKNKPTAKLFREVVEHFSTLYLFNCAGTFEFALEDLTELSSWISSGQIVVLDTPKASKKEFEYAVIVGQLLALVEPETHIEVISAVDTADMLILMLQGSNFSCNLIRITQEAGQHSVKHSIPSIDKINQNEDLKRIKLFCDALNKMFGKPNTLEKLKNSLANVLVVEPSKVQHLIGMLINLKIIKKFDEQISYRKKLLKQWADLDLEGTSTENGIAHQLSDLLKENIDSPRIDASEIIDSEELTSSAQEELFKNFAVIDPVQLEVARKLRELKTDKPKDIYALRDLLEEMFPKSDVRLLLKELLEKGYIYWNGHEVLYSHEMFLN
jgi:hypothetical protein